MSRASLRIPPIFPSKECSFSESGNRFTDLFFLLCHFWSLNFRVVCSSNSARIRLARFINKPGAIIMLSSYNCSSRLADRDRRLSISRSEPSPALSCCIISNVPACARTRACRIGEADDIDSVRSVLDFSRSATLTYWSNIVERGMRAGVHTAAYARSHRFVMISTTHFAAR